MKHLVHPPASCCKECEGACCKRCPGPYHPSNFQKPITANSLLRLMEAKRVVLDWTQYNGRPTYFLRPPSRGDNGHFVPDHSRDSCTFLTSSGCNLPLEERPLGCKNMKPHHSWHCRSTYGQYEAFRSWARYRKVLEEVMDIIDRRKKGDFSL